MKGSYETLSEPSTEHAFSMGYTKLLHNASKANIVGPFDKIGVAFQPLGINHFLKEPLSKICPEQINLGFDVFKPQINNVLTDVFKSDDLDEKVAFLDAYFLSEYQGFKYDNLKQAVELIHASKEKLGVEELSLKVGVSRKTLLRSFKKHLDCTVVEYINLIRFRRAVEQYQNLTDKLSLTEVALEAEYYDQSEFIHHFKKLTGFSPKSFFKNLTTVSGEGTYWTFD